MDQLNFNVVSNWSISNDRHLIDAVTYSPNFCESEDEVEDTVSLDSCIHLNNDKNNGDKCLITLNDFQAETDVGISQLIVVSEAKKIELYTEKGEYLLTANSQFITKIDDFIVYKSNILLPNPLKSCVIKLLSLRIPTEVWLYGIRITLKSNSTPQPMNSNLDLNKVLHRINECEEKMSDKAKDFAKFLTVYQTNKNSAKSNSDLSLNFDQMMKLFKNINLPKNKVMNEQGDDKGRFEDVTSILSTSERLKCLPTDHKTDAAHGNDINSLLTNVIKRELYVIEDRISCRLEKHLQEMEMRLTNRLDQMGKMMMEFNLRAVQVANLMNKNEEQPTLANNNI